MIEFKNGRLTEALLGDISVEYYTWVCNESVKCYFDVIVTKKKLVVVGQDIVANYPFKRISDYGAYFGEQSEDYEENYYSENGFDWEYGDGEINFFFIEISGKEWFISFPLSRREDAMSLYKAFEKCFMKELER